MEQRLLTAAQLADYGRELKSLCGPAGGEDGYGGVANESGEIAANTSLPMPGFTFQGLPAGAEPTDISFTSSNGSSWMVELYPGLSEDAARPLYTISPAPGSETASVRLQFKVGDNAAPSTRRSRCPYTRTAWKMSARISTEASTTLNWVRSSSGSKNSRSATGPHKFAAAWESRRLYSKRRLLFCVKNWMN